MRAGGRRFGLGAALAMLIAGSVRAATYLPISDADLAARSPVVFRAAVAGVSVALETVNGADFPMTYVTLDVLESIKGDAPGSVRLRLPGGRVGDVAAWLPGTPQFVSGQEVILLARPAEGRPGVYHLSEFGLGRFDVLQDKAGRRFAMRPSFDRDEDLLLSKLESTIFERGAATATPLRDADSLLSALRAESAGAGMPDVLYAAPRGALSATPVMTARPEWVNLGGAEPGNCPGFGPCLFRWFWDTGASPTAVVQTSGTQTNLSDSSDGTTHAQNGVTQWQSGVPSTDIHVSGLSAGNNITIFLDADTSFDGTTWTTALPCSSGGIIGLGGPGSSSGPKTFKGDTTYYAPNSGQVSMRHRTGAAGCYSAAVFRTAVMHELGHVLGLGHPDQGTSTHSTTTSTDWNNAVMHSSVPAGTPSTPQTDDIQAMQYYYGTGPSVPIASFTFSAPPNFAGVSVSFTDTSTGSPTSWAWNFGDPSSGGSNTSALQNPTHTFASAGTYSVSLTATNASGPSTPVMHSVVITGPPAANFSWSPLSPVTGQSVTFSDLSSPAASSWSWNFGDPGSGVNNTSSAKNPTHTFSTANTYSVTLTATNGAGSGAPVMKSVVVTNPVAPTASFTFSPPSPAVGQTVFFTDTSTGAPTSWSWNFGDLTSSTAQNPGKIFGSPGTYTVTLTASNLQGSSLSSHQVVISATGSAPTAAFTFAPPSPQPGQSVSFTDASSGGPTSWFWSFGDGGVASSENPSHTYAAIGTFTVSLTAQNAFGSNQTSHSVTVTNVAAPAASFNFSPPSPQPDQTISFTDTSSGGPTTWTWDFGDGQGSSFQNPSHMYLTAGSYTVGLTVSNTSGTSQTSQSVVVSIPTPCPADPGTLPANARDNFCITLAALDQRTGHAGPGLAIPQNVHFGYFSIPSITNDPGNPEVFVKVLDGRSVNGHFWVFYGGLTDLQYTITVRDFQTGLIRQYTKPFGTSAGGFDVLAFAAASTPDREKAEKPPLAAPPAGRSTQSGCLNDFDTLCLDSARGFTVTLAAVDQRTGHAGLGQAIPQSDVFGYFSIPALTSDPTNPEVFVKVLDGRAINGHFWVFYGGLTDLQYTITVRDTVTGQVRTYFKAGGSADGGFDVLAF